MLVLHDAGAWRERQITVRHVRSSRAEIPAIDRAIDVAWQHAIENLNPNLFDGPMSRLESWHRDGDSLLIALSQTTYKFFYGANLLDTQQLAGHGPEIFARPLGASAIILTRDQKLLLGQRNAKVAYNPNRLHPFGGAVEPGEALDLFNEIRRELHEELSLDGIHVTEIICTGLVEDMALRHPELTFLVQVDLPAAEISARLQMDEHDAVHAIELRSHVIEAILSRREFGGISLTPVAIASLALLGRLEFGRPWFARILSGLPIVPSETLDKKVVE